MAHAFHIRPGLEADADAILELHVRAIREICSRDYTPEQIEAWAGPKLAAHYLEPIRGQRLLVAELGGRVVGMGDYHVTTNEICAVYVDPDFGGQGIGRALFQAVTNALRARGFTEAVLDASLTSVGFYQAMGCRIVEQRMHTFRPGVSIPCVRMTIEL
jgi:ribosomal protein S18 acetylase RimI-like enzyme